MLNLVYTKIRIAILLTIRNADFSTLKLAFTYFSVANKLVFLNKISYLINVRSCWSLFIQLFLFRLGRYIPNRSRYLSTT